MTPRIQNHLAGATVLACVVSVFWCPPMLAEDQPSPIVVLEISEDCGGAETTVDLVAELARQLPTAQFLLELDHEVLNQPNRDIWQVYARQNEFGACELWLTHGAPIYLGPSLSPQPSQIVTGAATEIAWFVDQSESVRQPRRFGSAEPMNPLTVRNASAAVERAEVAPAPTGLPLMEPLTLPSFGEYEVVNLPSFGDERVALGDLQLMNPLTLPSPAEWANGSDERAQTTSSDLMEPLILPGPGFPSSAPAFIELWVPSERSLMEPVILPDQHNTPEFTIEPYVPSGRSN